MDLDRKRGNIRMIRKYSKVIVLSTFRDVVRMRAVRVEIVCRWSGVKVLSVVYGACIA